MRNDVKLGFAIGGVLLAVLIVYVLVVPGGSNPKQTRLDNTRKAPEAGKVTLVPVPATQASAPPAAPQGEFTPGAPIAASPLSEVAVDDSTEKSVAKIADPTPPAKSKEIDWNKLLNGQQLMTQTPTPADASHAAQGGEGRPDSGRTIAQATPTTPGVTPAATPETPPSLEASTAIHPPSGSTAAEPAAASETTTEKHATPTLAPGGFADSSADAVVSPVSSSKEKHDGVKYDGEKHDSLSSPSTRPSGATASSRTHKVQSNETLSTISAAAYGSANYWPAIVKANPGLDPNRMRAGQTINLPEISTIKSADPQSASAKIGPTAATATIDTTKQYRVQAGDSLHKISVKLYGKSLLADKIYELNKQMIGEDPARLKPGQVLQLPEPPTATAAR